MSLPFFYVEDINAAQLLTILDEDTSKHITQVLRMKIEDKLLLTDGKGIKAHAVISNDHRKRCEVKVESIETVSPPVYPVTIGISLIKNAVRFEWFLEKATEIGVSQIIPLLCERTEKEKFRHDRLKNIMVSAMLQSQQCWLPLLHEPLAFTNLFNHPSNQFNPFHQKFIAHCLPDEKYSLTKPHKDAIILIGPEGDFTPEEIEIALVAGYQPVTLGTNRLRTETAGVAAAVLLC